MPEINLDSYMRECIDCDAIDNDDVLAADLKAFAQQRRLAKNQDEEAGNSSRAEQSERPSVLKDFIKAQLQVNDLST